MDDPTFLAFSPNASVVGAPEPSEWAYRKCLRPDWLKCRGWVLHSLPSHHGDPDLRRWSVPGFRNFLLFYLPTENGIELVRVLHGAQDIGPLLETE